MNRDWRLALDQGGHATRAIVFDRDGHFVAKHFRPVRSIRNADLVEHDAAELVQSVRDCLDDLNHELGADLARIACAGLATQRSSIVCWDRVTGAALSPVISWQDRRNHAWLATLEPQREFIEHTTGLVLSPHYGAGKMRWCLDNVPDVQKALAQQRLCIGPLSSFLLHALLRDHPCCVDPANASRTQLWSPADRNWSEALLNLFGIPVDALPICVPTWHEYGELEVGSHTISLRVCTGDQAAVPFAAGKVRFDTVYMNVGTGAFLLAPLEQDLPRSAPLLRSVLWSDARQITYALEGTVNGAASALGWYSEQSARDAQSISQQLDRNRVDALAPPIFLNGVGGVGSPYWLPQLTSRFIPDQPHQAASQAESQVAAIVESIAFLIHANLDLMLARQSGLSHLTIGGGLSQCRYLCETLADLTGLSLTRSEEPELTAKGLAYLVAGQPDRWATSASTEFTPHSRSQLQQRWQRWRAAMSAA